ncbi:MAG: hypothetical protein WBQ86_19970, partial [Candidatus Binatus sp.]
SGLRIGMMRLFGIWCRSFLVPWEEIRVSRKNGLFGPNAELRFGNPLVGRLKIDSYIADRLARASLGHWPEPGPFPGETSTEALVIIVKQWLAATLFVATFFFVVPRMMSPNANLPISVAILFPAIVFGFAFAFEYYKRTKR